jgi:hypothetical protein
MNVAKLCFALSLCAPAVIYADVPPPSSESSPQSPPQSPQTTAPPPVIVTVQAPPDRQDKQPQPRTVERGGGIGRMFAWTTMLAGSLGGSVVGGLAIYARVDLEDCKQNTIAGLGCEDKQRFADETKNIATVGGIAAGALTLTSVILFAVTEGKHTVIEYGDPPPPELPYGGYVATAVTLGGAITAHVMMSNAADDLGDPSRHPTQEQTESLASKYRYLRYAAGGLYGLTAAFGLMSALDTLRVVRAEQREAAGAKAQVSIAPTPSGAVFSLVGRF